MVLPRGGGLQKQVGGAWQGPFGGQCRHDGALPEVVGARGKSQGWKLGFPFLFLLMEADSRVSWAGRDFTCNLK